MCVYVYCIYEYIYIYILIYNMLEACSNCTSNLSPGVPAIPPSQTKPFFSIFVTLSWMILTASCNARELNVNHFFYLKPTRFRLKADEWFQHIPKMYSAFVTLVNHPFYRSQRRHDPSTLNRPVDQGLKFEVKGTVSIHKASDFNLHTFIRHFRWLRVRGWRYQTISKSNSSQLV